jgi:hypothetical protein
MPKSKLTSEAKRHIASHYLTISAKDIGQALGVRGGVISRYMKKNGLLVPAAVANKLRAAKLIGRSSLTEDQKDYIRINFLSVPVKTMANHIGKSESAVKTYMGRNQLIIPPEIITRNKLSAQIKPGNVPANKGRKQHEYMTSEQIGRTAATRFKKGNIPPNAFDQDGVIVIRHDGHKKRTNGRPYKYIRLALGKWREYHLYLWEKENGRLPKGHCLWFIDGNSLNVCLENLELITRKENRLRNASWNTLTDKFVASTIAWRDKDSQENLLQHPEIIDLKRKTILLNRAIKQQNGKSKQ